MVEYEQGGPPEFSKDGWFNVKPTLGLAFPNLPYLIDQEAGVNVTETFAIHQYLAAKYSPDLLGKTPAEQAHIAMLAGKIYETKMAITGPSY